MRYFKTGSVCTRIDEIIYNPKQIFIGCPFKKEYFNMVNYVIKPVCEGAYKKEQLSNYKVNANFLYYKPIKKQDNNKKS